MRMKTILIGIIISLLLLALPASASDYTLGIFGNANEDDTINMQDVTYTELIILEYKDQTQLADAKYDGEIDILDVTQIELIILGREKELTLIDGEEIIVTVKKPIETIIIGYYACAEAVRGLDAKERVIAVDSLTKDKTAFYPELSNLPSIGNTLGTTDYEKLIELKPDIVISPHKNRIVEDEMLVQIGIPVVHLKFYDPPTQADHIRKLGYILNKRERAEEYIDFIQEHIDAVKDRVEMLSEEDRPKIFLDTGWKDFSTGGKGSTWDWMITTAGGKNIAGDLEGGEYAQIVVESEWVIEQNPSIIIFDARDYKYPCGYPVDDPSIMRELREQVMNRPGWEYINAVKNEDVYLLIHSFFCSHTFIGIGYMGEIFHPELFEDLDPQAVHQEFIDRFCPGLDFDVSEHGVFVYHPEKYSDGR